MLHVVDALGATYQLAEPIAVSSSVIDPPPPEEPEPSGPDPVQIGSTVDASFIIQLKADEETGTMLMELPYAYRLTSGAGWLPADRDGYSRGHCFLAYPAFATPDNPEGICGQASFHGKYGGGALNSVVFDKRMDEGERYYDGTPNLTTQRELNDIPIYEGHGVQDLPVWKGAVRFFLAASGEILEFRPYENLVFAAGVRMAVVQYIEEPFDDPGRVTAGHRVYERIGLAVYYTEREAHTIYYDSFDPRVKLHLADTAAPV